VSKYVTRNGTSAQLGAIHVDAPENTTQKTNKKPSCRQDSRLYCRTAD